MKNRFNKTTEDADAEFRTAYRIGNLDGNGVSIADMMAYTGLMERTIWNRLCHLKDEFRLQDGVILEVKKDP